MSDEIVAFVVPRFGRGSGGPRQASGDRLRRQAELGHHPKTVAVVVPLRELSALELIHTAAPKSDRLIRSGNRLAARSLEGSRMGARNGVFHADPVALAEAALRRAADVRKGRYETPRKPHEALRAP